MNVYEKLNEARLGFQSANVKKSGKNDYTGYTYYELADILPKVNELAKQFKFSCVVEFTPELATLSFIDLEKPTDKVIFTSPMSEASLRGCHAVQNLGAVETYIKRYLYQNCFEIVEGDALDSTMNPKEKIEKNQNKNQYVQKQDNELNYLVSEVSKILESKDNGFNDEQIRYANWCLEHRNKEGLSKIISSVVNKELA